MSKKKNRSLLARIFQLAEGRKSRHPAKLTKPKRTAAEPSKSVLPNVAEDGDSSRVLNPVERAAADIRKMKEIGDRDPRRLAGIVSSLIRQEHAKKQIAQARLNAMVKGILSRECQSRDNSLEGGEGGR